MAAFCTRCKRKIPDGGGMRCDRCPEVTNGAAVERKVMFLLTPVPKHPASYGEIAEALGCSKEQARQLCEGALRKLRALGYEAFRPPDEERSCV